MATMVHPPDELERSEDKVEKCRSIVVKMGLQKGDSSMDDTVEVIANDYDVLPPSYDSESDYGRDRNVIATFANPKEIDWEWIRSVAPMKDGAVLVYFCGPVEQE